MKERVKNMSLVSKLLIIAGVFYAIAMIGISMFCYDPFGYDYMCGIGFTSGAIGYFLSGYVRSIEYNEEL